MTEVVRSLPGDGPLEALSRATGGQAAYLSPHHLEAGRRIQRLFARAHLQPRITQSFSALPRQSASAGSAADITDMAAAARKRLAALHEVLPGDCAGVVIDVCGFEKGLQQIETERGWPRRSAKLVLRIALDRLAEHFGLSETGAGGSTGRTRAWAPDGARPTEIG